MADQVTGTGSNGGSGDTASGFGATAESDNNNDQINQLLDQVRDLLAEDGVDYATADALTNFARRSTPTITGNLADLQRMGSIVVQGRIPANAMPAGQDQEVQETSNLEDAFAEPPGAAGAQAGLQTPMGAIDADGNPTGGTEEGVAAEDPGDSADTGTGTDTAAADTGEQEDLSTMTKAELTERAEAEGVSVSSSMTKQEIIDALNDGGNA